jgi:peptide/nickel transport system substrate-binding protein
MALDASGQRVGALIFQGLTRTGPSLEAEPDLALSWKSNAALTQWTFLLDPDAHDHEGTAIRPSDVYECLEEYRSGKPKSLVGANLTRWKGTRLLPNGAIEITLHEADPYFPKNGSLLRFFRWGKDQKPCSEPTAGTRLVGSGPLRPDRWEAEPRDKMLLHPVDLQKSRGLELHFVRDELSRLLRLLNGTVDAGLNSLSLSKGAWLQRTRASDFKFIEREGVNVQYLAFNGDHPIVGKKEVRQAISLAVDRDSYCRLKSFGYLQPVGSLLSPILPEAAEIQMPFDPATAEKLLDAAGFPRRKGGIRFTVRYKTTPLRDGFEIAQYVRAQLARVGIQVQIEMVEPALFFASLRAGNYEMHSGRWIGVSDGSILWRTLHSASKTNRVRYKSEEVNTLLNIAMAEPDSQKRVLLMKKVQHKMAEDLPYAPLWIWKNQFIVRSDRAKDFAAWQVSPSAAIEPLTRR